MAWRPGPGDMWRSQCPDSMPPFAGLRVVGSRMVMYKRLDMLHAVDFVFKGCLHGNTNCMTLVTQHVLPCKPIFILSH